MWVDFNGKLFHKLLPYRPICIEIAYQSICTEISMQKSMNNCYHINRYALELHIVRYALKFQWNKALIIATTSTDVQNWLWLFVLGWSGGVFLSSWYKADTQPGSHTGLSWLGTRMRQTTTSIGKYGRSHYCLCIW